MMYGDHDGPVVACVESAKVIGYTLSIRYNSEKLSCFLAKAFFVVLAVTLLKHYKCIPKDTSSGT
jgi:hypothetical protein